MCQCSGAAEHEHNVDEGALASNACSLHQYIDVSKCQALNARKGYELGHILRAKFVDRKGVVLESETTLRKNPQCASFWPITCIPI